MQRLKSQNNRFYGLLAKARLDMDEKKEIVYAASAGRTQSSRELTAQEMQRAIDHLAGLHTSSRARMMAKARAISNELGLIRQGVGEDGKLRDDYTAMNSFIMKKFKKPSIFQLDDTTLRHLITALEKWQSSKGTKAQSVC
jgi:hypothetical protein